MTSFLVTKRNGLFETFSKEEIKNDIAFFLTENIKIDEILEELERGLVDKIETIKISELLANICASKISWHPDHNKLASAICIMKLHKETSSSYSETMTKLYKNEPSLISEESYNIALKHSDILESAIDYNRDFLIDFFGLKTLERSYLKKIHSKHIEDSGFGEDSSKTRKEPLGHNNEELKYVHKSIIIERPQHLWMTVSIGIHGENIERVLECYDYMSRLYYVPATPSLYNLGTNRPQGSSCFILGIQDNIESIFKVVGDLAKISKFAGGIGVTLSRIRAKNSVIRGTNGVSEGIIPLCVMLGKLARYINQGGRRAGSIATYLEPFHADIYDFIELRKNTGDENNRARDLFLGLWINDLFMKRVEADEMWSLMCPDECPGLVDSYGDEFEKLYLDYEAQGKYKRRVKAKDLWYHILDAQCETGMPYMCYKDHVNRKTNHQNVGVINSSNLCVAPETKILTEDGEFEIKDLESKEVKVWNGQAWSQTKVVKTGENQHVIGIDIIVSNLDKNGKTKLELKHIECTPYHKFLLESDLPISEGPRIEAKDLERGTCLRTFSNPDGEVFEMIVQGIYDYGRKTDTYCFNEPQNHTGVFNGILTGNCSEIMEHYNENEYAVCNLSSICLPKFVKTNDEGELYYDFQELLKVSRIVTRNLDKVIDVNFYPVDETKNSNLKMRPIGVGVQGLADVFYKFKYPYGSDKARLLNKQIFETIYYGALSESCQLAKESKPYDAFEGSPFSKGEFQFHMWGLSEEDSVSPVLNKYKWELLREEVMKYGTKNSLLTTVMPTASTSQIEGNTESIEPKTSNLYMRKTLAGEFVVINEYLVNDLIELGLWNEDIRNEIIYDQGSIQNIEEIPKYIKDVYLTAFEMKQRDIVLQSIERGPYIDQSQSLNLFMKEPDFNKLSSSHFFGWKHGIKTGMYYLRTMPSTSAIQFGLDSTVIQSIKNKRIQAGVEVYKNCPMVRNNDGTYQICESCT